MKRRRAIGILGGVAGGPLLAPPDELESLLEWALGVRNPARRPPPADPSPARGDSTASAPTLTPERARAMEALAAAIIPATPDSPGADEADVTGFVTALVEGWLDDDERDLFLQSLDAADRVSRTRFGVPFAALAPADTVQLLEEWDEEAATRSVASDSSSAVDLHTIRRFTLAAYFTSEAGLAALGHRTVFATFEGCVPLAQPPDPVEGNAQPGPALTRSSPRAPTPPVPTRS